MFSTRFTAQLQHGGRGEGKNATHSRAFRVFVLRTSGSVRSWMRHERWEPWLWRFLEDRGCSEWVETADGLRGARTRDAYFSARGKERAGVPSPSHPTKA